MFMTMFIKRPRVTFARSLSRATATVALPWYGVLLVLAIGMSATAVGWTGQRQPNILYIMADDHTSQAWGCYGGRLKDLCPTTNIDRLAREGARLTNCFCTNSICVPSRAAILTGQYSHINGVRDARRCPGTHRRQCGQTSATGWISNGAGGQMASQKDTGRLRLLEHHQGTRPLSRSDHV